MTTAELHRAGQAAARRRGDLHRDRGGRRLAPAIEARRRLNTRGRAWVNGHELGGEDPRFAQLTRSYD